jgi:plastocyanin
MRRGVLVPALSLLVIGLGMALPGSAAAQCDPSDTRVDIISQSSSNDYSPDLVNVAVGGTVCWTNTDTTPFSTSHTATSDSPGVFDSGTIPGGGTFRHTFTADATIPYHCSLHPSMEGTVRVGAGGPAPGGGGGGGGGQTGPGANAPPRFSSVRVSPSRACARRSRTCPRPGARVRFSLDERARVNGTLERLVTRSSRIARRFSYSARAGVNRVRLPIRGLRRGRYRLRLRATDSGGARSVVARTFRIVR